jgi:hypothetical protein
MGLLQLRRSTLQVSVERCRDLGESVEAWVLGAFQGYYRLLSATGTTRDVAVVAEAQLLVMLETKREQGPPGGIADRCLVGRVRCSRVMRHA